MSELKKYVIVGAGLVVAFVLYSAAKQLAVEEAAPHTPPLVAAEVAFDNRKDVYEHIERLQDMIEKTKEPVRMPFEVKEASFSVATADEHHKMVFHYLGEEGQELALFVTTYNPALGDPDYEKFATDETNSWLYEAKEQTGMIVENDGLYYSTESDQYEKEDLLEVLSSLKKTEKNDMALLDALKLPVVFPGEVLEVGDVRYESEPSPSFTVTYLLKEEYTVAYTVEPIKEEQTKGAWKQVRADEEMVIFHAKEDNQLLVKEGEWQHVFTSFGRELSLEEFLILLK